jgi:hypothetical protein
MATIVITLKDVKEADGSNSVDVSFIGNERLGEGSIHNDITTAEMMFYALFGLIEFSTYAGIEETVLAVDDLLSYEEDDLDEVLDDLKDTLHHDGFLGVINNALGATVPPKNNVIKLVVDNQKEDK